MKQIFSFLTTSFILVALAYAVLRWLDMQIGTFLDWGVGLSSVLWLIIVVTVPWDAHFRASEVLHDAKVSKRKDILVIDESLEYVKKVARNSLIMAISLHIISAIGLYFVAYSGISQVGYFSAVVAILLTFLRPSVRFYEFLQVKLRNIQDEFRYPREDLREVLNKLNDIELRTKNLEFILSDKPEDDSWKKQMEDTNLKLWEALQNDVSELRKIDAKFDEKIIKIQTENEQHFDKVASDIKLLDSVREIAKFVRELK